MSKFPKNIRTITLEDFNYDLLRGQNNSVDAKNFENTMLSFGQHPRQFYQGTLNLGVKGRTGSFMSQ